jgi:hypothetical protein
MELLGFQPQVLQEQAVKLVQLEQLALLALLALLDLKEFKVQLEQLDLLEHPVAQVLLEQEVLLERLVHPEQAE